MERNELLTSANRIVETSGKERITPGKVKLLTSANRIVETSGKERITPDIIKTMEQYKTKGKEIYKNYCAPKDKTPIMLPPAPKQTYIDVYVDKEGGSSNREQRLQANYEAEVEVYRALESLEEDILVLHGLDYSHHQYRMCDKSHERKRCGQCKNPANREGECDFVVIGRNYFVVIEVKNVPHGKDDELTEEKIKEVKGAYQKSQKQGKKMKSLIASLFNQVFERREEERCSILYFSAFPSSHPTLIQKMDEADRTQVMCNEDFIDLSVWWRRNVTDVTPENVTPGYLAQHEEVTEMLLALWCTDKNQCDELKCTLSKSIMDTDKELKRGKITFLSKNRPSNPNVIRVTEIDAANINGKNIFEDFVGVSNLTLQQSDAFNKDQNLLLINGPAGSGKTLILLGKIIQLIKSNEEDRVVLFIFASRKFENASYRRYQDTLNKADISNEGLVAHSAINADTLVRRVFESRQSKRVVIVRMIDYVHQTLLLDVFTRLRESNTHVIVDDSQVMFNWLGIHEDLLDTCEQLAITNRVWIACDLTQSSWTHSQLAKQNIRVFLRRMAPENRVTLSLNLRNTCDLAGVLSKIRTHLVHVIAQAQHLTEDVDYFFPILNPGHFIHGPRTVLHLMDKKVDRRDPRDLGLIYAIMNKELDRLYDTGVSDGFNVCIVDSPYGFNISTKAEVVAERFRESSNIELGDIGSCYSAEYPAVILMHDVFSDMVPPLYLAMSRARVYCSVILYTTRWSNLSLYESLGNLLGVLKDSVRIIRYDE